MPIVYKITTTLDNPSIRPWPPQIEENEFYSKLRSKTVFKDTNKVRVVRFLLFDTEEEFESWFTENRLTDPNLKSVLNEWADAYGLKIIEEYYRVSEYRPNIAGLFN